MASVNAADFWTDLYARGGDGWEIRQPAPPLVEFMDLTPPAPGRVAVPGCGRGHDVRFLARRGYSAVGFDFSAAAVAAARELCAIDPRRRAEYVRTMSAIVKPGGWLLACFFPLRRRAAGPPFPVSEREVRRLFAPAFRIERAYPPRSVRARQGQEWMVLLRRVNAPA